MNLRNDLLNKSILFKVFTLWVKRFQLQLLKYKSLFTTEYNAGWGFVVNSPYHVEVPFFSVFCVFLSWKNAGFCQKPFLHRDDQVLFCFVLFLASVNIVYYIDWCSYVDHPCICNTAFIWSCKFRLFQSSKNFSCDNYLHFDVFVEWWEIEAAYSILLMSLLYFTFYHIWCHNFWRYLCR